MFWSFHWIAGILSAAGWANEELAHLAIYNCARYRLTISAVERWIAAGRPGLKHAA
jgi:hypothetical protein